MITFPVLPGVEINLFLLALIGLGAGILSGFTGVGGAFVITPALIVLGLPANFAVGTSLAWIIGNSVVGTLRHRQLGNVDVKLGLLMIVGTVCGVELGVRLLNWARNTGLADEAVLAVSIVMLLIIGIYTFSEAHHRKAVLDGLLRKKEKLPSDITTAALSARLQGINIPPMINFTKSRITISLWLILAIGLFTGILAGFIGVGGGIIIVPSLIYLVGLPSFMAVGTSMFQIIFAGTWGCIRHTMSGNVIIFAAFIMLVASSIGVQFGALVTRYTRGISMRYILGISILICATGTILKLSGVLLDSALCNIGSVAVTFSGMGLTVIMISALFIVGLRYKRGQHIPAWIESLVAKED